MRLNTQLALTLTALVSIGLASSQETRCSAPDSGKNFTSWQGIIRSPGYDGGGGNSHYPVGENCNWNIVIPDVILAKPYFKLNLTFTDFNLGHDVIANNDIACPESGDYLQILGLRPGKSQPICRQDGFPSVASEFTRKLQIKFISDDTPDSGNRGFSFRYFFPDHPCAKCKKEDQCDESLPADQMQCINPCDTYQCGHGECHINGTNGQPYCKCQKCYHGKQCFTFHECRNGECLDTSQGLNKGMCNCTEGIKDGPCDEDPCQSKPCLNQGTCKPDLLSLYKCTCSDKFMGDNCERRNFCFQNPCKNGTCESMADKHKCNCAQGFHGENCDLPNEETRCSAPDSGKNFTSWQGIIRSPGYDGGGGNSHYPVGENCNWNIVIPDVILAKPYFKLNLTFTDFNLGHDVIANNDIACPESGDYLQILGLRPGKSQPICRQDGFPSVASEFTRKLQIKFISDDTPDSGNRGFSFRYFFPDHPCAKCKKEDQCDESLPADQMQCINPCDTYQCGHGECHINGTNGQPYCKCQKCYHGKQCFTFHECRNGECLDTSQGLNKGMCNCTEGIKDGPCDEDPCQSKPCLNQGTCKPDLLSLYKCTCSDKFMGDNCERRNFCFQNPCKNGTCESMADKHKCNCAQCFHGENCDLPNGLVSGYQDKTVYQYLVDNNYTSLVQLINESNLQTTLSGKGPFTVFAPSDFAIGQIDPDTMASLAQNPSEKISLIKYHVVNQLVLVPGVSGMTTYKTLEGQALFAWHAGPALYLNNRSRVDEPPNSDIVCSNGVVQPISRVLEPPVWGGDNIAAVLIERDDLFQELIMSIVLNNLTQLLETGEYTLFAPVDAAFAEFKKNIFSETVDRDTRRDAFKEIIKYHMVPGKRTAAMLQNGQSLFTLHGLPLNVTVLSSGLVLLNDLTSVVTPDISASNGVIHAVSHLMFPGDLKDVLNSIYQQNLIG